MTKQYNSLAHKRAAKLAQAAEVNCRVIRGFLRMNDEALARETLQAILFQLHELEKVLDA